MAGTGGRALLTVFAAHVVYPTVGGPQTLGAHDAIPPQICALSRAGRQGEVNRFPQHALDRMGAASRYDAGEHRRQQPAVKEAARQ